MLKVQNIDVYYGEIQALFDVSIELSRGELVSIIGSNGAGKSSLLKTIMGNNIPSKGDILMDGFSISGLATHEIVKKGIVLIPEGREVFPGMTVRENLEIGAFSKKISSSDLKKQFKNVFELFPRLEERQSQHAGLLSGGEQQMLAIGRGLMSEPKILLFDEPSLGLAPVLVDEMFDAIAKIKNEMHKPIILVEQNAYMALAFSDRAYVLESGKIVLSGKSSQLINDPSVKAAYLGA